MQYAIGYFDHDELERPFTYTLEQFRDKIAEVYFPWPTVNTCRTSKWNGYAIDRLTEAITYAASQDIKLDLLFNANCYGGRAISKDLESTIVNAIDDICLRTDQLDCITTTSPAIAHIVKHHYLGLKVRASVNMQLRNESSLPPLFNLFDEFYLPRELNYDFEAIDRWRSILKDKKLYLLANSGCMAWCPGQIFHDNMVSHEEEIARTKNIEAFIPYICWTWYKKNPCSVLQKGTWIRPEDIHNYEELFPMVKLATRINEKPYRVVKAYVNESFHGNILNLMEPDHSTLLGRGMLDNSSFPENWFDLKQRGISNPEELFHSIYLEMK